MQFSPRSLLVGASLLLAPVFAQTFTDCNPTNTTCPNDPALGISHDFVFNSSKTTAEAWNITAGSISYGSDGAEFTVSKEGDSPTIQSQFYIFFGSVSVIMKAAPGTGIISSIVLESDDLDEVDWEFIGGNNTSVETNYFGKGNTTSYDRAIYYGVSDPTGSFHNYTVDWTSDRIQWWIDSALVRTLAYADANGGKNFPQTPMNVRLGIWAGGDPDNSQGTIEWAGGETDYDSGPYTMYVKSAAITDYSTGSAYEWTDKTGDWQSIKVISGTSTVNNTLVTGIIPDTSSSGTSSSSSSSSSSAASATSTSEGIAEKFTSLPSSTKMAIYAGSGAAGAIILAAAIFACMRQRRAGRKEREEYNAKVEQERENAYRDQMELREKGLGGFAQNSALGEDELGGWAGNRHETEALVPAASKTPTTVSANEIPGRIGTPGNGFNNQAGMGVDRGMARSPAASIISPQPQSPMPPRWNGGNDGGLIGNAGNAYSGGYGGNSNYNYHSEPQPQHNGPLSSGGFDFGGHQGYSQNQGGYQRF